MKKYTANTTCPTRFQTANILAVFLFLFSFSFSSILLAQDAPDKTIRSARFNGLDRTIARGSLKQFKKECSYIGTINDSKILEIQASFKEEQKQKLTNEQTECYNQYLGQIVGAHNIYKSICDEITPQEERFNDKELARLFVNVRKFEGGIRPYHEKLNDCLLRRSAASEFIIEYSDFEKNSRVLSRKIKETNVNPPFRENRVEYR